MDESKYSLTLEATGEELAKLLIYYNWYIKDGWDRGDFKEKPPVDVFTFYRDGLYAYYDQEG